MIDVTEILMHWHAGRSKNQMAASLGVDRKTLRKYIAPAEAGGIVPGGPAKTEQEWAELVRGWFPELADTRLRQVTWPAIAKHHEYITAQLAAGVRVFTVHQRLRDEHGLAVSVASVRRYVAANVPEETRRSQVRVLAPLPAQAGEQAQIDYGQLGRWLDPVTGKLRTIWAFVMVLCCSRHMQDLSQMGLVPDEGAVQEFAPASPDPAFGDRVHAGRLDVAEHRPDISVGEDGVERGGEV